MAGAVRPATGPTRSLTGLDAGTDAGTLFADVRQERQDERDEQKAARARIERRERRQRLVLLWTAVGLSVLGAVISIAGATTRSEAVAADVAAQVAPQVSERVVQDARAARVDTGRRALTEANTQLIARDLPVVGDPGNGATGDELVIAAATARVLAILPETTVGRLRDEVADGRTPPVLPSASASDELKLEDGDVAVEVIPLPGATPPPAAGRPGADRAPAPRRPGTAPPAAPRPAAPQPAPAPPPGRDRGLCLLGSILCES